MNDERKVVFMHHSPLTNFITPTNPKGLPCISTFIDIVIPENQDKAIFLKDLNFNFDSTLTMFVYKITYKFKFSEVEVRKKLIKADKHLTDFCKIISEYNVNTFLASNKNFKTKGLPAHWALGSDINEFAIHFDALLKEMQKEKKEGRPQNKQHIPNFYNIQKELIQNLIPIYEQATGKKATRINNAYDTEPRGFALFIDKITKFIKKTFSIKYLRIDSNRILQDLKNDKKPI